MNTLPDKFFRDRVSSLDSVSPPTNWNPESTWNRISKTRPWHRRPMVRVGMTVLLILLLGILLWPKQTAKTSTQFAEVESPSEAPSVIKESIAVLDTLSSELPEELNTLVVEGAPVQNSEIPQQAPQKEERVPERLVPVISAPLPDSTQALSALDSTLHEEINIASTDTLATQIENAAMEEKGFTHPKITISLHSNKVKEAPVKVQRSIIKLKNDYRYHTNKKTYTVQIK